MIRVNLLPIKQQRRRTAGKTQLGAFVVLLVLLIGVLGLVWVTTEAELSDLKEDVATNERDVKAAKAEVKDAEQLQKDRDELTQQLKILDELEKQRSGPVRVLDELQSMVSPPRNEEDRFAQLRKNWNVEWDTRRLWIESFKETNGTFSLKGSAVNADDVAEFLQRLSTGQYFYDVELDVVTAVVAKSQDGNRTVNFDLRGKVSYSGRPAPGSEPAVPAKGKKKKG
ncbi:MAG: PilN domain-containing protein [bacterium]